MSDQLRVLGFAVIVCLGCSLLVSSAAITLRDRQEANLKLDMCKNILKSVGLYDPIATPDEVNATYDAQIRGFVVSPEGEILEGVATTDVNPDTFGPTADPPELPLYTAVEDGEIVAYSFPIYAQGLWSRCDGYFALEADLDTVKGITFYKHGETPGLGGEIDKPWFQNNFVGKKVLDDDGTLLSVTVLKGDAEAAYSDPEELEHYVDGISGATMTARGVSDSLIRTLKQYEPYFSKLRSELSKAHDPGKETTS